MEGWGTKVIERLSNDLRKEFPDMKGISVRNLKYMKAFSEAYPLIVQQPVAQLENVTVKVPAAQPEEFEFMQQAVAQIPWGQNIVILDRIKEYKERLFYAQKTFENNWSRNVLVHQIESDLYSRQGKAVSNFHATLPKPHSDFAGLIQGSTICKCKPQLKFLCEFAWFGSIPNAIHLRKYNWLTIRHYYGMFVLRHKATFVAHHGPAVFHRIGIRGCCGDKCFDGNHRVFSEPR